MSMFKISFVGEARQEFQETVPRLYYAILKNDTRTVLKIIKNNSALLRTAITRAEETVLHIAAGAKHVQLVKELVKLMEENDLALQDCKGNTAFCYATISGSIDIAIILMNKNKNLPLIRGGQGMTPLYMATLFGHNKMSWFLYPITKKILEQGEWIGIFFTCINSDLFGLALKMLEDDSELAIARDVNNDTALHILARKTYILCYQTPRLWTWKSSSDITSSLVPSFRKSLKNQALQLVRSLWNEILVRLPESKVNNLINKPSSLLFEAAELGNFQFLAELIHAQPDLVWDVDEKNRTIFHIAVLNRHSKIFNLIHEIGSVKDVIITYQDDDNNNILHMAATLPPPSKLDHKLGGTLQIRKEISWFKEVQKHMMPSYAHMKNSKGLTPLDIFNTTHESMLKDGERWMKSTSKSCLMVSILIFVGVLITTSQDSYDNEGRNSNWLNSVALSSSFFSTLTFLSIITSSYPKVLASLHFKLIIGLATIFISLTTMLVAFNGGLSLT
uniref:Ankyrin repeat-containing protein n=1 Tax=Cannabis sativa TaxID=3483 RepID=A0A803QF84_CANSA